jgi:hypothetical protein
VCKLDPGAFGFLWKIRSDTTAVAARVGQAVRLHTRQHKGLEALQQQGAEGPIRRPERGGVNGSR